MAIDRVNNWMTAKTMADACQIDFRTFKKLGVEPVQKGKKGQSHWYAFGDVMRAWHSYQLSQHVLAGDEEDEHGSIDIKREAALKVRAEREGIEIKNNVLRESYVPVDVMQDVLGSLAMTIDGVLSTIPLNIKRANPELGADVLRGIEKQVIEAQNKLAEIRPESSE